MAHRGAKTTTEQEKDPGFIEVAVYHMGRWAVIHPVASGVTFAGLLAVMVGGWVRIVALAALIAIVACGVVFREQINAFKADARLNADWQGTPGRVGLAAELGLVPQASKKIPRVHRIPTERGFDVEIETVPGITTAEVIDRAPAIGEALGAVEVTAERIRGTRKVLVHCVTRDVLTEDVSADWVVDSGRDLDSLNSSSSLDSSPDLPLADRPYWEVDDGHTD